MEQFLGGLSILMQWQNLLVIPLGLAIGIVVGAIPGLTSDPILSDLLTATTEASPTDLPSTDTTALPRISFSATGAVADGISYVIS